MANNDDSSRIEFAPAVAALLQGTGPQAELARCFLRFAGALLDDDQSRIDGVVSADARFHELEAAGLPRGPIGLKLFRKQLNSAFPDEHVTIAAMRFEGDDIIETDLDITATHKGELMGNPATGNRVFFKVHTRNRFVGGKMVERWDQTDIERLMEQLKPR
jgi:predicted ester cyclase